jgi:hypothetical protein
MDLDLVNEGAKILSLLFCRQNILFTPSTACLWSWWKKDKKKKKKRHKFFVHGQVFESM